MTNPSGERNRSAHESEASYADNTNMRKTIREMKAAKREAALVDIRDAVARGSLRIRQMTEDDRVRYAARACRPGRTRVR
jgi:hypothetical protein